MRFRPCPDVRRGAFAAFAVLGLLGWACARGQTLPGVPDSRQQITLSFAPLVRQATPAVVNIFSRKTLARPTSPLFDDPVFQQLLGRLPRQRVASSLGSGVIVDAQGLIVTNNHVIRDSDEITVALADRREFAARVVAADARSDLAVLRIDAGGALPFLGLHDSDDIAVGDLVLAIGNPFGVGQTVTMGIVSALARTAQGVSDYDFFIQTDAAINPGNSGGALLAMDGRLVGINAAIYSRGGGSLGIGFAIPSNMVRTVVEAARRGVPVTRSWLGAEGQAVTPDLAASVGLARPIGAILRHVYREGPAAAAGLRVGDVVTAIDGHEVDGIEALRFRIATLPPGTRAELAVVRGGSPMTVALTVALPPEDPPRDARLLSGREPLAGARVANLSPALVEELGLPEADTEAGGVAVLSVEPGSLAGRIGLQPADIVLALNGVPVGSVGALVSALAGGAPRWLLSIRRKDQVLNTIVPG
jgi:serine protease Do